jgi:hypothetical protein
MRQFALRLRQECLTHMHSISLLTSQSRIGSSPQISILDGLEYDLKLGSHYWWQWDFPMHMTCLVHDVLSHSQSFFSYNLFRVGRNTDSNPKSEDHLEELCMRLILC